MHHLKAMKITFFLIISFLYIQGAKIGGKRDQFGGKSKKMLNSVEFMEFVFFHVCLEVVSLEMNP